MGWLMVEYLCGECRERFESLEDSDTPAASLPHCGKQAPRTISAIPGRMARASVVRGESQQMPPGAIDTRPLAEGMSRKDYRKMRAEKRRQSRIKEISDKL